MEMEERAYVIGVETMNNGVELVEVHKGHPILCSAENPVRFNSIKSAYNRASEIEHMLKGQLTAAYNKDTLGVRELEHPEKLLRKIDIDKM